MIVFAVFFLYFFSQPFPLLILSLGFRDVRINLGISRYSRMGQRAETTAPWHFPQGLLRPLANTPLEAGMPWWGPVTGVSRLEASQIKGWKTTEMI